MHALVAGHAPARWSELSSEEVAGGLPSGSRPTVARGTNPACAAAAVGAAGVLPAAVEAFGDLAADGRAIAAGAGSGSGAGAGACLVFCVSSSDFLPVGLVTAGGPG